MTDPVDKIIEDRRIAFDQLLQRVENVDVQGQLRELYEQKSNTSLARQVASATVERDELARDLRHGDYRAAGVPDQGHEILDAFFEGDPRDHDAVHDFAKAKGLAVQDAANRFTQE